MNGSTGGSAAGMFSWDNLRELTELDGHIEFAGELLMRYGLGRAVPARSAQAVPAHM